MNDELQVTIESELGALSLVMASLGAMVEREKKIRYSSEIKSLEMAARNIAYYAGELKNS
jgi:hypothetical protein